MEPEPAGSGRVERRLAAILAADVAGRAASSRPQATACWSNSPKLLLAIQDHPGFPSSYRHLAACYAHMGWLDEARSIVARLRAITPLVVPGDMPFHNPADRELYLSGLRLAMGETA
jgi:hypothetical protein